MFCLALDGLIDRKLNIVKSIFLAFWIFDAKDRMESAIGANDNAGIIKAMHMSETLKPKLTYLDYPGLGEAIRLTLRLGEIEFDDIRISAEFVPKMRSEGLLPCGQVPLLEVGKVRISQSDAILRWAGKISGFYPRDHLLAARCDMVLSALVEVKRCINVQWYGHVLGRSPRSSELLIPLSIEQTKEAEMLLNEEVLPTHFSRLEKILGKENFFCGQNMTISDIEFYCLSTTILKGNKLNGIQSSVLDKCPNLIALVERIKQRL